MTSMLHRRFLPFLLLFSSALAANDECGLYLAVSSTSDEEHPKWGLYTGITIPPRSPVGSPEVAVQTHNLMANALTEENDKQSVAARSVTFFEEYIWVADATAGRRELGKGRIVSAIPGAGVLGGFNAKLTNSDWYHMGAYSRQSLGDKNKPHPGRGAYSHFYNVTLHSLEEIPAGSEIFVDYGENWDEEEKDDEEELTKKDFEKLDQFVEQMIGFFDKYKEELTEAAKKEIYEFLIRDIINAAAGIKKGKKMYMLLPKSSDGLVDVKTAGGSLMYSQPSAKRSIEWLKENGLCMDNLIVKPSTIPHAGNGAFAKRNIAKGGLVSPAPLIQISDKSIMNMHEIKRSSDENGERFAHRVDDDVIGHQLLLNYCWGHPESSLLFFPAGSGTSFINHSSKKANAKMVFSKHPQHLHEWTKFLPTELVNEENLHIGLLMEIVATRDIKQGEEVLIDYGREWENAWNDHEAAWNKKIKSGELPDPWPTRALDVSDEYKSKPFPTKAEGASYPENIRQMCFLVVKIIKEGEASGMSTWATPKKGTVYDDENLFDCTILERIELKEPPAAGLPFNYTIEWLDEDGEGTKVVNVPHQAIVFVDKAETGDQFVEQAFRHYIGIPDDVFPQGPWRDLKGK